MQAPSISGSLTVSQPRHSSPPKGSLMPQPTHTAATDRSPHSPRSPLAVGRDEGEHLALGDITIIVKATAENTAGSLTVFEEVPPLGDVGLHIQHNEDEIYYVLVVLDM